MSDDGDNPEAMSSGSPPHPLAYEAARPPRGFSRLRRYILLATIAAGGCGLCAEPGIVDASAEQKAWAAVVALGLTVWIGLGIRREPAQ